MLTTLTLDDDVAAGIERLRESRHESVRTVVNDVLRRGLVGAGQVREKRSVYRTRGANMGSCRLATLDDVSEALAAAEGDSHP